MKKQELVDGLKLGMFADRPTIKEAYEYGASIAEACGKENAIYVFTALHVLMNTIANEIAKLESV